MSRHRVSPSAQPLLLGRLRLRRPRFSGLRLLVGVALTASTIAPVAEGLAGAAEPSGSQLHAVVNVRDHLNRVLSGNLGRAEIGGPYSVSGGLRTLVRGGQATVGPLEPGHTAWALL